MTPKKILHINVRLQEGGAAGVARTLVLEQRKLGHEPAFAYGYGPGGGPANNPEGLPVARLTSKASAAAQLFSHRLIGKELPLQIITGGAYLKSLIRTADLIHLHVIHSYFLDPLWLLDHLRISQKPVVWTLHDQWAMTGRCAQPLDCRSWQTGCSPCPHLDYYPPATLDLAGPHFEIKRHLINRLAESGNLRVVSCARWLEKEATHADLPLSRTIHNSVDLPFWRASQAPGIKSERATDSVLFVCRDLRDKRKVNWDLLAEIARDPVLSLTIIGDGHLPDDLHARVQHLPATSDRQTLATTMRTHGSLLFTSQVDYHPLTIAEALTAGMRILAVDSPAAREFDFPQVQIISPSIASIRDRLRRHTHTLDADREKAAAYFHPDRMTRQYSDLYQELLSA